MTIELDFRYFVRIPKALTLARAEGYISPLMYEIMHYVHENANRRTGFLREFDVEKFIAQLPSGKRPAVRTAERHLQGAVEAGWLTSGYKQGKNVPYGLLISNFRPAGAKDAEEDGDEDGEKILVNRSQIKHWKETAAYQGEYEGGDEDVVKAMRRRCEDGEKAANTTDKPEAQKKPRSSAAQASGQNKASAEESASPLMVSLPRIAAKILQNTHKIPRNLRERVSLIEEAHGVTVVEDDFTKWCEEVKANPPTPPSKYPVTDYLRLIDSRLGNIPLEPHADTKDPAVKEIGALTYKLTGVTPSARSVANLRLSYDTAEIKAALTEYASSLEVKDFKASMRTFFTDGGAGAVILARRNRTA